MKNNKIINYLIIISTIIIIALITTIIYIYNKDQERKIFSNIEQQLVYINKYTVYGTHLNLSGSIQNIDLQNIKEVNLIFKINTNDSTSIKLNYKIENNELFFNTSELINKGIDLETISSSTGLSIKKLNELRKELN